MASPVRCRPLVGILIALMPLTALRAQETEHLDELRARAGVLLQEKMWSDAAELLRRVVHGDQSRGQDWFQLGYALHQGGVAADYPEALAALEQAVARGAQVPSAMFRRARILAFLGQSTRALQVLDTLVQGGFARPDLIRGQPEFSELIGRADFAEVVAAAQRNSAPCMADPEARALDFWVGEWDVFTPAGPRVGGNRIERVLGGCALLENWTSAGGREGKSLNLFDPAEQTWKQFWIDDQRWIVYYTQGGYRDGAMRMQGMTYGSDGATVLIRMDLVDQARDTVRQIISTSPDQGRTWSRTFEGIYVRKSGGSP